MWSDFCGFKIHRIQEFWLDLIFFKGVFEKKMKEGIGLRRKINVFGRYYSYFI